MQLKINLKSVYGNVLAYPGNDAARLVAGIANKTTLSVSDLARAAHLGHTVSFAGTHEDAFQWTNRLAAASNSLQQGVPA